MKAPRLVPAALLVVSFLASVTIIAGCTGGGGGGKATVSALVPAEGSRAGGTLVRILGTSFGNGPASILFDGIPATEVTVVSDNEITCRTPATELAFVSDVLAVDVDVRSSGNTAHLEDAYQYINNIEPEPQNGSGVNDGLGLYHRIPIDADFTGYIGEQGDIDVFHLHTPADGRVEISVTWAGSYTSAGLAGIEVQYFHGPEPEAAPNAYYGGRIASVGSGDPGDPIPEIRDWLRMAYVNDGHGPYIMVQGIQTATHIGYDPVNPYTIHARFVTDPTFEPAPAADSFHSAQTLPGEQLDVSAAYDQDYDWFAFVPTVNGGARVTLDASTLGANPTAAEIQLEAKLFRRDAGDPNILHEVAFANSVVGDPPSVYGSVFEVATLTSNTTYYLRLNNFNLPGGPTSAFTYPVAAQVVNGLFEDTEPGNLGAAETPETARTIPLTLGVGANATGYSWHYSDDDWFKVTTPPGTSNLAVSWDVTNVRAAIGDEDDLMNPFGGTWGVMVFDEGWFTSPGHIPAPGAARGVDFVQGDNIRATSFVAGQGSNFYIFIDTVSGFSVDPGDAYTLTITAN